MADCRDDRRSGYEVAVGPVRCREHGGATLRHEREPRGHSLARGAGTPAQGRHPRRASVILEADDRITETIKWKSPTFMYEGNLASIDPKAKKHVAVCAISRAWCDSRGPKPQARSDHGPSSHWPGGGSGQLGPCPSLGAVRGSQTQPVERCRSPSNLGLYGADDVDPILGSLVGLTLLDVGPAEREARARRRSGRARPTRGVRWPGSARADGLPGRGQNGRSMGTADAGRTARATTDAR